MIINIQASNETHCPWRLSAMMIVCCWCAVLRSKSWKKSHYSFSYQKVSLYSRVGLNNALDKCFCFVSHTNTHTPTTLYVLTISHYSRFLIFNNLNIWFFSLPLHVFLSYTVNLTRNVFHKICHLFCLLS